MFFLVVFLFFREGIIWGSKFSFSLILAAGSFRLHPNPSVLRRLIVIHWRFLLNMCNFVEVLALKIQAKNSKKRSIIKDLSVLILKIN